MDGLGNRIRELRKQKQLTLIQVSSLTDIDVGTLSRIENGKMQGTVESHFKIAGVLGISLAELYGSLVEEAPDEEAQETKNPYQNSKDVIAYLLAGSVSNKKMMPVLLQIKPGGYTETEVFPLATERFIYVIESQIVIHQAGKTTVLNKNESLYFNATSDHYFENRTDVNTSILSVTTMGGYSI